LGGQGGSSFDPNITPASLVPQEKDSNSGTGFTKRKTATEKPRSKERSEEKWAGERLREGGLTILNVLRHPPKKFGYVWRKGGKRKVFSKRKRRGEGGRFMPGI